MRLGPPPFDAADRAFAEEICGTLSAEDIAAPYRRTGLPPVADVPLCDAVVPLGLRGEPMLGSTDVGDVSWVVPLVQADGATCAIGTPFHTWQLTAQGKTPMAKKGMVHVAKAMAATAVDALRDPSLIARAREDLKLRTASNPYISPLPADLKPNLPLRAGG